MSTTVDLGKITASVTVGTTTTGAAGTNASVSNSGTTQDAVLNFTIPRGAQGVQGPQGSTGPQGPAGPTGPQGPMGDVAVITPEQQAAFTMYSEPGQNTNGPMTQKAVTDALVADSITYNRKHSQLSSTNVQDALDEIERNVVDGDYIQGDEISLNSILPGYIKTDGTYRAQSGFSTNTYRVENLEKIMVEVQTFTEPPVSTQWFFYIFWSDSQAVTPTMARTSYANNSKFVLDVPQGSKYFGIMTVVNVNNVSYGSTSNVSVYKCDSLKSEVEKITTDLYSSETTDFPTVLNYSTIKNGYVRRSTGNFVTYSSNDIQTAFYDVSKAESIRVNCVTPSGAPYCAFYGADGETALNGRLNYQDGSEFIVPNGAVYFAITFRFNDNLSIDTFTIRANINAGLINQVESLNDLADLYKSLFDWSPFTWLLVGDSLTEPNARAATQYYEWIDKKTNIHWINKGQSGKGYANGDYFYSVFNSLSESFSFATIFGSGNDIRYESFPTLSSYTTWDEALGDIDDNGTTSICGYINRALDKFYEVAPLKKIGLITPTPWKNGSASGVTLTDEETMRRMRTYSEKLVLIARKRGIPCLDLFNSSGLRPWNEDFRVEYYNENGVQDSGVHPNSKGHKWISNMFLNFIFQYLVE